MSRVAIITTAVGFVLIGASKIAMDIIKKKEDKILDDLKEIKERAHLTGDDELYFDSVQTFVDVCRERSALNYKREKELYEAFKERNKDRL